MLKDMARLAGSCYCIAAAFMLGAHGYPCLAVAQLSKCVPLCSVRGTGVIIVIMYIYLIRSSAQVRSPFSSSQCQLWPLA
jgi:hypothetical protein